MPGPDDPLTDDSARARSVVTVARDLDAHDRALRWLVAGFVALFALTLIGFGYSVAQSYTGRVQLRDSQVAGCERGKRDRAVNAFGWRTAEQARRQTGKRPDLVAADRYARIARSLEQRARIDCGTAYPAPSLLP